MRTLAILAVTVAARAASAQAVLPPASATPAPASTPVAEPTTLSPTLRFDRITGMARGGVTTIVQDNAGFIWFGTEEGLSRFDGYEFVNYIAGTDTKNTLSNFFVTSLAPGKDSLWVGTVKGLDRLDLATNKFTPYKTNPQDPKTIASDYIVSLHMGASLLWIGTAESGVDSLNPQTGEIKHYRAKKGRPDALSEDAISVVLEDRTGKKVWIGARETGLNLLDPATGKVTRYTHDADKSASLTNDQVTALYQDSAGTLWVGTIDGINRLDPSTSSFKHYMRDPQSPKWITTIVEGKDGGIWFGVKGIGVYRLDPKSGATERYTHDSEDPTTIANPWTLCAFSDRGGVLWFGFEAGGASKLYLTRRHLAYYRTSPTLAFLEQGDQVWLGGLGLRSLDTKTGALRSYFEGDLKTAQTIKIIGDDKGSLWIGTTEKGLLHFMPRTNELHVYDTENGRLDSDAVFALLRDGDTIWIGTYGGVGRLDNKTNQITYYRHDAKNASTLSSDEVVALYQDKTDPNTLWVGTTAGLNALDKRSGKVVRYLHEANKPISLSNDHITDMHEDKAGTFWIATWGGGLNSLDRKTGAFKALHTANGLASEVIYGILEDKSGALWLTTNNGLTKYEPKTKAATTLRASDGLQDDEFGQGGFHQGASGRFYVGGPGGFNMFMPEEITSDTYVPPMVVTKFEILGEARPIPDRIKLSYRDRWFSVAFSALAYASPAHNRYKYRLEGFHDWIETDRRFVNYSGLPPGDYTLEIIGSNAHGVWNEKGVRLPIRVPPPPWRTWWAYAIYGLLIILIIALFIRRQRGQLEALRQTHRLSELEREMALTSAVQEGFFPADRSVRDGVFRLEAFYRAAAECGGDWWSYEARGDSYFILVGDATGHGAGSAMVTAAAAACFRSLGRRISDTDRLEAMNEEVLRVSRGQYHMTLTAVEINIATGRYVILSAGGVPVFTLPPDSRPRVLMCPGTPLGSEVFELGQLQGQLAPGERLLIMTDGIPEVALANQQLLGPRGVANFYMQTRAQELETALQQLISQVEEVQSTVQDDDWTAVMAQWGNPLVLEHTEAETAVGEKSSVQRR